MIYRPSRMKVFEFAVVASLRADQLRRGCTPLVDGGHNCAVTAQLKVMSGKVMRVVNGVTEPMLLVAGLPETSATARDDRRPALVAEQTFTLVPARPLKGRGRSTG